MIQSESLIASTQVEMMHHWLLRNLRSSLCMLVECEANRLWRHSLGSSPWLEGFAQEFSMPRGQLVFAGADMVMIPGHAHEGICNVVGGQR